MRAAVIDTNVVVSGLLANSPDSPLAAILDGMLDGRFPYLLSPDLAAEYRTVLLRPKIRRLHGLSEGEIELILIEIAANAVWREPEVAAADAAAPDPGDDHLWRLLRSVYGTVLVTGDRLLLENPPEFAAVLSPRDFLALLNAPAVGVCEAATVGG